MKIRVGNTVMMVRCDGCGDGTNPRCGSLRYHELLHRVGQVTRHHGRDYYVKWESGRVTWMFENELLLLEGGDDTDGHEDRNRKDTIRKEEHT